MLALFGDPVSVGILLSLEHHSLSIKLSNVAVFHIIKMKLVLLSLNNLKTWFSPECGLDCVLALDEE